MTQAVRQTRTHIGELLARRGLSPRHDLGQNFLIDLNLLEFLVAQAELTRDDVVLEVGSGTGGLTAYLARQAGAVVSVEIDARMRECAADATKEFSNVTLLGCDVLKNKNHFAQPVLDALDHALQGASANPSRQLKLVANLPYCVATPVISNLLASDYVWERMVVTIQLELAQRMTASEQSSNYGALSVWLQSQCRTALLKKLPPDVFWPRPKVDSAMIRIDPDPECVAKIANRAFLHDFLRDLFQQRRKLLRSVLGRMFRERVARDEIGNVLNTLQLGENARAEELSVPTLVELCNRLYEFVSDNSVGQPRERDSDLDASA